MAIKRTGVPCQGLAKQLPPNFDPSIVLGQSDKWTSPGSPTERCRSRRQRFYPNSYTTKTNRDHRGDLDFTKPGGCPTNHAYSPRFPSKLWTPFLAGGLLA